MARIVFISLFLGLVSGVHPLDLSVDPEIRMVRLFLDSSAIGSISGPPWHAAVDFGTSLIPRKLLAIGYDKDGDEIGRAIQTINMPRRDAEVEIVLEYDRKGIPVGVKLTGKHIQFLEPVAARVTFDGRKLKTRGFTAQLPQIDATHTHVVAAEMSFEDGATARRELVLNGGYFDSALTELTPIPITTTPASRRDLKDCFSTNGVALRTAAVERTDALVIVVKDPEPQNEEAFIRTMHLAAAGRSDAQVMRQQMQFDPDTTVRILWPVAQRFARGSEPPSVLFEKTNDFKASRAPMTWLLPVPLRDSGGGREDGYRPRQFADAVATAALDAMIAGRRRAVILILSDLPDESVHNPSEVREYLSSVGVPLFVWSLSGPRPDLTDSRGEVVDVSSRSLMAAAVKRVRASLESQEITWLAADPLAALRAEARPECGVVPLAGHSDK